MTSIIITVQITAAATAAVLALLCLGAAVRNWLAERTCRHAPPRQKAPLADRSGERLSRYLAGKRFRSRRVLRHAYELSSR